MNISKSIYAILVITAICISSCSNKKKYSPSEPPSADIEKKTATNDEISGENAVKLTIMVQKP